MSLNKRITQFNSSIKEIEEYLSKEDFEEYCDSVSTCIALLNKVKTKLKS